MYDNELSTLDKELIYLAGKPIYLDGVPIRPITLNEISEMGYVYYMVHLKYICADIGDVLDNSEGKYSNSYLYPAFVYRFKNSEEHRGLLFSSLSMVCKEDVEFLPESDTFKIGDGILGAHNFVEFQAIVKERNGISKVNEAIENPENAKAAALLARKKELEKKVEKAKQDDDSGIGLTDLISTLAVGLHMPISEVCEYDMYQFNNQLQRLKIFKDYDTDIQALLAGAEKVDLKHWMSKIDSSNA